ncbi:MAG: type III pantothenate kinase [Oscillospiraceae bacterium]|nr:type III pantothenate kinase [Oscillospiraceae bacterium]
MLFAIDMGNTTITLGCLHQDDLVFMERLSTNTAKSELEYAIDFKNLFELHGISVSEIKGCALSSVVPQLTDTICQAVKKVTGLAAMVVGPGVKTGLHITTDNPAQLGSDLVVDAVAALKEYKPPLTVIDMGTATTFSVIDAKGRYIGSVILPGPKTALDSLITRTAQLPRIAFEAPRSVIGSNSIDSMKSGLIFGNAACIDGLLERVEEQIGRPMTVIATGGCAEAILPHCKKKIIYDPALLLKGLRVLFLKNTEEK